MTDKDFGSNRQGDLPSELVARLEVASEGSDELDHAMSMATGILLTGIKENGEWGVKKGRWTQSLDAALGLVGKVLPGWGWCMRTDDTGQCFANMFPGCPNTDRIYFDVYAATHPLALCLAVLKATTASALGTDERSEEVNQEILEEKPE